jgi:SAM-dependent methyltransferase
LCGATDADFILSTNRLDGPLLQCLGCGLYFVSVNRPNAKDGLVELPGSEKVAAEMVRLAERARELNLVEPHVEQSEKPWRELMARERLYDLKRFASQGRLLEIGCSTGEMLLAAKESFDVIGVEADVFSSRTVSERGVQCFNGALADAKFDESSFDVAAMYHVIEHFPSPRAELNELHRILKPGGLLAIETPNIANVWFRLLGARWRQFIPDHLFFFTPQTIRRLCEETGFEIVELRSAGKVMSARLLISRIGRYHQPTARALSFLSRKLKFDDRTIRLNLGDVMRLYARRKET